MLNIQGRLSWTCCLETDRETQSFGYCNISSWMQRLKQKCSDIRVALKRLLCKQTCFWECIMCDRECFFFLVVVVALVRLLCLVWGSCSACTVKLNPLWVKFVKSSWFMAMCRLHLQDCDGCSLMKDFLLHKHASLLFFFSPPHFDQHSLFYVFICFEYSR